MPTDKGFCYIPYPCKGEPVVGFVQTGTVFCCGAVRSLPLHLRPTSTAVDITSIMLLQVVTVGGPSGDKKAPKQAPVSVSPSLRFRGQPNTAMFKPVRPARPNSMDLSTKRAVTTAALGCAMILGSVLVLLVTGAVSFDDFGLGILSSKQRHEIHIAPMVQSTIPEVVDEAEYLQSPAAKAKNAVLYTVFGDWTPDAEWEFTRLVTHVTRSNLLTSFDIVLMWETADKESLPESSPFDSEGVKALLAANPRVSIFHVSAAEAALQFPPTAFQHGFYYNPEVAAILFLTARADYDFLWLIETDVRWTGDWAEYFLQPYMSDASGVDLFAFRSSNPWNTKAPGWETSNCFTPLGEYPQGWHARGENATNLPVEWAQRIACFMPSKRMSAKLLKTLNQTYLSGEGGYNEVVVPTINAVTGGTFGTAEQACMLYSYKNDQASSTYDSFRLRAIASVNSGENEKDVEFADTVVPCMLHPVKPKSANKPAKKDSQ